MAASLRRAVFVPHFKVMTSATSGTLDHFDDTLPPTCDAPGSSGPVPTRRPTPPWPTCGADVLIMDLEDLTPPPLRPAARAGLAAVLDAWRTAGSMVCVRINALDGEGPVDLAAAMAARPDVVAYPMATTAAQMQQLGALIDAA